MHSGYDGGKKIKGIKRHIAVDINGLPLAIYITTANIGDRAGAIKMFNVNKNSLCNIEKVIADGGYTGVTFSNEVNKILGAEVEVIKRSELHSFKVLPKRWIVERSFAWLEKNRRLWKNCERTLNSSLHMTIIAFLRLLLKRF